MKVFRHGGIRRKLTMIVMASSCAALLLACLAFVINDLFSYREVMLKDLTTRAKIIGNNSTAALSFGDPKPVEEIMAALSADPHLVTACVFDGDGRIFAQYHKEGSLETIPALHPLEGTHFTPNHLHLSSDILFNGRKIGTVFFQSDLLGLRDRVLRNAAITALVMLAAIGVAFLLAARLQRVISVPITQLAAAAVQVARDKNYSVRASKQNDDELGRLVEGFNEMLEQIQKRDAALQRAHDELEHRVEIRTRELSQANESLNLEIETRKRSQQELESMQQRLMDASRQAGMAEVATGVLHNVGNVLNSVNVSATLLQERLRKSKLSSLVGTADLLQAHAGELTAFLSKDPRGKLIPGFIIKLAAYLSAEQDETVQELSLLSGNIEHIKEVVARQQSYARVSGVMEFLSPVQLVEVVLRMNEAGLTRHGITVVREFSEVPDVAIDKHKALQILVNLVRNAEHALMAASSREKRLTIRVSLASSDRVRIVVKDNGVGIPTENLTRIFGHGFTTKKEGHGFGLHSGALAAKEMGGSITAQSEGLGKGAEFTLELPARQNVKAAA